MAKKKSFEQEVNTLIKDVFADPLTPAKCNKCKKHSGTEIWVGEGGAIGYIHGVYEKWCKCCVVKEHLKIATSWNKKIPELKKKLKTLTKICKTKKGDI